MKTDGVYRVSINNQWQTIVSDTQDIDFNSLCAFAGEREVKAVACFTPDDQKCMVRAGERAPLVEGAIYEVML